MGVKRTRISAFLLDILFVMLLTTLIANVDYLNPYLDKVNSSYEAYSNAYVELAENLNNKDQEKIVELTENLKSKMYNYEKTNTFYILYYLIFVFIYFVIFQWWNKGQTLGKKFFKLRVVNDEGVNPNFIQYIIRTVFNGSSLIFGVHIMLLIRVVLLLVGANVNVYYMTYTVTQLISYVFEFVFIMILLFNNNGKSLNDLIACTKVISVKN